MASSSNLLDRVRTSSRTLNLSDILHSSPQVLLGVDAAAVAALSQLDIKTVFDLSTSQVFNAAGKLVTAANDTSDLFYKYGSPPSDLVKSALVADKALADLQSSPIIILRDIPDGAAASISTALDVDTVRDFAFYPPYRAAVDILNYQYFPATSSDYDPEAPVDLIPKSGEYPTEKVQYTTLLLGDIQTNSDLKLTDISSTGFTPLSLGKLATADVGFKTVAFGALLTFTQSWFAQGVTLGQLLHSMTLAPGESTRIAVVDWSRKSTAGQTEVVSQTDALSQDTSQNRAISEVTSALANEAQSGFSGSNTSSKSTQSGTSSAGELSGMRP